MYYFENNCKNSNGIIFGSLNFLKNKWNIKFWINHLNDPSFHKTTIYILEMVIYELSYLTQTFGLMLAKYWKK
jgi:hypothetical protein